MAAYKNSVSIDEICKNFNICRKIFYMWRKREATGGDQATEPKCHRLARFLPMISSDSGNCAFRTVRFTRAKLAKNLVLHIALQ
ncbi:MAG: helix-turn-helix domain-containing protein [Desulfovibrio sp.]|nr:helix-turn-helix domain-containing protein [Desulfovibrio sp.]